MKFLVPVFCNREPQEFPQTLQWVSILHLMKYSMKRLRGLWWKPDDLFHHLKPIHSKIESVSGNADRCISDHSESSPKHFSERPFFKNTTQWSDWGDSLQGKPDAFFRLFLTDSGNAGISDHSGSSPKHFSECRFSKKLLNEALKGTLGGNWCWFQLIDDWIHCHTCIYSEQLIHHRGATSLCSKFRFSVRGGKERKKKKKWNSRCT